MYAEVDIRKAGEKEHTIRVLKRWSEDNVRELAEKMANDPQIEQFDLCAWETKAAAGFEAWPCQPLSPTNPTDYAAHKCRDCTWY